MYISHTLVDDLYRQLPESKKIMGDNGYTWNGMPLNRYMRMNGSLWVDVKTGEFNLKGFGQEADDVARVVKPVLKTNYNYKYD